VFLNRVIAGPVSDEVPEIVSLGNTLKRWRTQISAHHLTGASNGPTEATNLLVKKIKWARLSRASGITPTRGLCRPRALFVLVVATVDHGRGWHPGAARNASSLGCDERRQVRLPGRLALL
jgi:hypothetical protein